MGGNLAWHKRQTKSELGPLSFLFFVINRLVGNAGLGADKNLLPREEDLFRIRPQKVRHGPRGGRLPETVDVCDVLHGLDIG